MTRKLSRYNKRSKMKKRQRRANLVFTTIGVGFFILIGILSFEVYIKRDLQLAKYYKSFRDVEIPAKKVCMWEDKIRINPTIPINIDSVLYYACCEKCMRRVETNFEKTQMAIDPYSGERVRKSDAYIRLKNSSGGSVLYFESEENYHAYINRK